MPEFVGRQRELEELNAVLRTDEPQFVLIYGRRRVGKTTLVLRWAKSTGRPFLYWVATRDTAARVRAETQTYEALLKAVASGLHTPSEIGKALELTPSYLSPYFKQLESLRLLERRLPATVPPEKRRSSRKGRYHLVDPYLRFFFRFIATHLNLVEQELTDLLWQRIRDQFRAFVGLTAFEDLCREWTLVQARAGGLPFAPERVGSHWAKDAQVDVVAIDWQAKAILLGECKWGAEPVRGSIVRGLQRKAGRVVPGDGWDVYYVLFARAGFSDSGLAAGAAIGAELVNLEGLEEGLAAVEGRRTRRPPR